MSEQGLTKQRKNIKSMLKRINTFATNFNANTDDIHNLRSREQKLNDLWKEYDEVQSELEDINEDHFLDRDTFEDSFYATKSIINKIFFKSTSSPNHSPNESSSSKVKLPEIQIPSFNGNFQQWNNFHDIFRSIIHDNEDIPAVQKLFYLKGAVKGEAAQIIEAVAPTPENYIVAWQLLKERYDNKEFIINSHLKTLFDIQPITKGAASNLRNIINVSKQHIRALGALGLPTNHWDAIILYLLTSKLDPSTRQTWQLHKSNLKPSTLDEFYNFLEQRCSSLELFTNSERTNTSKTSLHSTSTQPGLKCKVCGEGHDLFYCETFLKKSINDRVEIVKKTGVCFNCLRNGHSVKKCKASACRKCNRMHHTLIHFENFSQRENNPTTQQEQQLSSGHTNTVTLFNSRNNISQVLLPTAIVQVKSANGQWHQARVLLDGASQSNFITEEFLSQLRVIPRKTYVRVNGINQIPTNVSKQVCLTITSTYEKIEHRLDFLVINKITQMLPTKKVSIEKLKLPENLILADPNFYKPQQIDMLLGAEIFYDILLEGRCTLGENLPILQQTKFGWTIAGKIPNSLEDENEFTEINTFLTINLEDKLSEFWKIENCYIEKRKLTSEERVCEKIFEETVKRNQEGRYIVKMPIRDGFVDLGDSYEAARKRFLSLERRLVRNPELYTEYAKFMNEYLSLKHMKYLETPESTSNDVYYIPHHCVLKPSSTTTKLRVVFDASMKSTNGKSLNDNLLVGPTLHEELFATIIRFRLHKVAFTSDIKKMYRQILISEEQRDLQRIIWRDNPNDELKTYQLSTVTYGLASAPYLATRSIQQLARDEEKQYPLAAHVLLHDMYVDDILTGANDLATALELQTQLKNILNAGGFELHKWSSNNEHFLNNLPDGEREVNKAVTLHNTQVKTLGLLWLPEQDRFKCSVNFNNKKTVYTKRFILAEIASIFDPLGVFGPIIVKAKLFMKELWKYNLDWDEEISQDMNATWLDFRNQIRQLADITIDRCIIGVSNPIILQLHGFADASEMAYGACIYLRAEDRYNNVSVNLICAKSRVAPMKTITLPRLELCGAVILAQLIHKIKLSLNLLNSNTYLWTDSTVVLSWISSPPHRWKTFIANRIAEIQELTVNDKWNHVQSGENPADPLSRGALTNDLQELTIWWKGPHWLSGSEFPCSQSCEYVEDKTELKSIKMQANVCIEQWSIFTHFSNFSKLRNVIAYCQRFIHNARSNIGNRHIGPLTAKDTQQAITTLVKIVQEETFQPEIKDITNSSNINKKSKLISLNPFLDKNNILRVGGRISFSMLPYAQKHQAILPSKHPFTKLLIENEHKRLLHANTQAVLFSLRQNYWVIGGRSEVRQVIHRCMTCFKYNAKNSQQIMGELPDVRVQPIRPFYKTGVDYGGPFLVRRTKNSRATCDKIYIALFICMATKAIHLEIVSSLSSEDFINALKRFIARRGRCHTIYSDNASTFKGANNALKEIHTFFSKKETVDQITKFSTSECMDWKFIPPRAPNFGGLWEAGIKTIKHHIKRVIGESKLLTEDFITLLTQIESCVNSRPLITLSDDPSDTSFLSPAHFLIGEPMTQLPDRDMTELNVNRLTRYQLIQHKLQHFWKKWSHEYLTCLQQRYKWNQSSPNIHIGALVLIREIGMSPNNWIRGRVLELYPGQDGRVRVVTLKTSTGTCQRAVRQLCLLPSQDVLKD